MLPRIPPALVLLLLLCTAGKTDAQTAAIVDLNIAHPTGSQLLDSIRRDMSVAGYTLNERAEVLRGLNGAIEEEKNWSKASELLASAETSYESFKLDEALASLLSLDALLVDSSAEAPGKALLARRYLLEGLIRFAQGRTSKAIHGFRLTNRLTPSFTSLDEGKHRPTVVKLFEEAVQQNKDAKAGPLLHKFEPSRARLHIDGTRLKKGERVSQGPHVVMLTAEGYETESSVRSFDDQERLKISLKPVTLTKHLRVLRQSAALSRDSSPKRFHKLAKLTEVDVLVLVHSGPEGPRAAIYNRSDKTLSPWVRVGSVRWQSLLSGDEPTLATVNVEQEREREREQEGEQEAVHPWYRQWWGGSLIVGGTAAVGTALYFALSASDSSESGVTIDQWCFGSCE